MKFNCPHCGQSIEADVAWAGHKGTCPSCSQAFTACSAASAIASPMGGFASIGEWRRVNSSVPVGDGAAARRHCQPACSHYGQCQVSDFCFSSLC
jgi:hypothetical protein